MQTVWKIRGEDRRKAYAELYQQVFQHLSERITALILLEDEESDYVYYDPRDHAESSSFDCMEDWLCDKISEYLHDFIYSNECKEISQRLDETEDIQEVFAGFDSKVEKQLVYDTLYECNANGLSVSEAISELYKVLGR
jgi:hypothetical protein